MAALLTVGAVVASTTSVELTGLDRPAYDLAMRLLTPPPAHPDVTVVLVDDESLARLGERWPLSRGRWAALVDRIAAFEPAAITIDAWFESPAPRADVELAFDLAETLRTTPGLGEAAAALAGRLDRLAVSRDGDRAMARALAEAGVAVLGIACITPAMDARRRTAMAAAPMAMAPPGRALLCAAATGNTAALADAARGQGVVNLLADDDGVTRRYPFVSSIEGRAYPSLALVTAQVARPSEADALLERALAADRGAPALHHPATGSFRTVRFSDVLEIDDPSALRGAFAGRMVLVGVSALGTEDAADTPLERQVPGVFVHAQALSNLLDGAFFETEVAASRRALWAGVALALLLVMAFAPVQSGGALLAVGLGVVAGWGALWGVWLGGGQLAPLSVVVGALSLVVAARLVFAYGRASAARARAAEIRRAFQTYVPPAVVQTLVDDPGRLRLGGERREITALFTDIHGFTRIAEEMEPDALVGLLNECLGTIADIVLDEGGTVDKFIGDAVVAMWGAPVAADDHAEAACRAALRCQAALDALRERWVERGLPPLSVRIGLNSGMALVGNMGAARRFDYTMIGDAVNLAARLEEANGFYGTQILVGERTMALAGEAMVFREVDRVRPRGKMRPVRIGELLGRPGAVDAAVRARAEQYQVALRAYRTRRWGDARAALAPLVAERDGPAMQLAERVERFELAPPSDDWDGVFNMP